MKQASGQGRLKILYVVPGTRMYAGIERVVDEVCSELAVKYSAQFDVDVLFTTKFQDYEVGDRPYHKIQTTPRNRTELLRTIRTVISQTHYDLIVVPQIEVTVIYWAASLGLAPKFVLHLHGNPERERSHIKAKILFAVMKRLVLPRLAGVFGTSPRQLESFKAMFPSKVPHVWVPNPVRRFATSNANSSRENHLVKFVSVARFTYQKGQDLLISAFAKLYQLRQNARLRLVGYGADEAEHKRVIESLGLSDVLTIEYFPHDPQVPLQTSDVYVCSSRWEGWSIAICEALRFGLPVVSTDCEFGPSDILTDGRLGRLVPVSETNETVDALVEAMLYYCDNLNSERKEAEFRKSYVERFSIDQVAQVHATAISSAVQRDLSA